jgi:hypothetical protein
MGVGMAWEGEDEISTTQKNHGFRHIIINLRPDSKSPRIFFLSSTEIDDWCISYN